MDIKLNIWQTRDLTLFGRTMLVKTLGLSKLVYAASMLLVPKMVIKLGYKKKFLRKHKNKKKQKNKNDKIKRSVIYKSLSNGGLNFRTLKIYILVTSF